MDNYYKGQGSPVTLWIIFSLAAIVSTVMSQTVLTSSMEQVCPGNTIIFTCTTTGSSLLVWKSNEYIGSGIQIEFRSIIDPVGTIRNSTSNPETVANLTAINDGMLNTLTSTLRIETKSTTPNISVSCINAGGMTNTSTIPLVAVPRAPQNVRAAEVSERIGSICIILVTWNPPANTEQSDIGHYIVTVTSRNTVKNESSAISVLRFPNCRDNDTVQVAAVNRFGCVGVNSSEIKPSLFNDSVPTTGSTTPNGSTSTSTTIYAVVIAVLILAIFITFVMALIVFFVHYKRGKKTQVHDALAQQEAFVNLRQELQGTSVHLIEYDLQQLYEALKMQPEIDSKIRVAARALSRTLEKRSSNKLIKEALKNYLEKVQTENGEDVRKALNKVDNVITRTRGISEEFKANVRLLRTEAGKDKHEFKKILDNLIKKVDSEEVQPDEIRGILLALCKKLQYIQQVKDYYHNQSKYDINDLGTEKDRVSVPIWIHDKLDGGWKRSLHEAVKIINEAAPGLSLLITEDKKGAIVHVLAFEKEEAYTEGNILMRSIPENSDFITKICLGKWEDDRKKEISIHELLHALGFHHEHQHSDTCSYEYHSDSGNQITIDKNWLDLTRFDPFSLSIMLYPCEKKTEHPEIPVWLLKVDSTQENRELSELDKVGLNLVYRPCGDTTANNVRYRPNLGKNGMYYCGRRAVTDHTYPRKNYVVVSCEPNNGPNCPACRTIKSQKVEEILIGGRWQGMTGAVYCGRPFAEPAQIYPTHDGVCGMNNGPACSDCDGILNKETDLS